MKPYTRRRYDWQGDSDVSLFAFSSLLWVIENYTRKSNCTHTRALAHRRNRLKERSIRVAADKGCLVAVWLLVSDSPTIVASSDHPSVAFRSHLSKNHWLSASEPAKGTGEGLLRNDRWTSRLWRSNIRWKKCKKSERKAHSCQTVIDIAAIISYRRPVRQQRGELIRRPSEAEISLSWPKRLAEYSRAIQACSRVSNFHRKARDTKRINSLDGAIRFVRYRCHALESWLLYTIDCAGDVL